MVMFWVLAAVLCASAAGFLLMVKAPADAGRSAGALEIYKDQLLELDRDIAAGVISADEAQAQRTEISRRLLAAGRDVQPIANFNSRHWKFTVLAIPVVAVALYVNVGRYGLPDVPRAERLAAAETSQDWAALIARVEQQLEKTPGDVQGWKLLVPHYLNLGRFADAARAMGHIISISGPTPDLLADMAEALVFENKGLVTAQSIAIVAEALKLDATHPKAQFYHGLGQSQEGKTNEAKATFQKLLANAPSDASWRSAVEAQLAKLDPNSAAPQISAEQMQGAEGMAPEDRMAMIRNMVDGLDAKLKSNSNDIEGWLRLIRARIVLKEVDKASTALAMARATFATNPDQLNALNKLAQELSVK